jgi:O-antigen/teichoic acid export membrane protein
MRNLATIFAGELIARFAGLVAAIVVARHLGPVSLGALAVAQGVIMLAASVVDGGLTLSGTNALVRHPRERAPVIRDVILVQGAGAVLLSAGLAFAAVELGGGLTATLLLALLPYLTVQVFNLQYVLQAGEQFGAVASARAVGQTLTAAGAVAAAAIAEDPVLVAVCFWAGPLITDLLIIRRVALPRRLLAGSSLSRLRKTLRDGRPYLAGALAGQFVFAVAPLALGLLSGTAAAGQYSAAFRTFFLLYVLVTLIVPAVYPEMVRRHQRGAELQTLVAPFIEVLVRGGCVVAALVIAAADHITAGLFGSAFSDAAPVLAILAFVVPVVYFNAIASRTLMATGQQRVLAKVSLLSALLSVVLYPGLVWLAGEQGCALAFLLIILAQTALMALPLKRAGVRRPISPCAVTYLFIPLGSLLLLRQRNPGASMVLLVAVWIGSVLLLEMVSGRKTWRQALVLLRSLDVVA